MFLYDSLSLSVCIFPTGDVCQMSLNVFSQKVEHFICFMHDIWIRYSNFRPSVHISKLLKCGCTNLIKNFYSGLKYEWPFSTGPVDKHLCECWKDESFFLLYVLRWPLKNKLTTENQISFFLFCSTIKLCECMSMQLPGYDIFMRQSCECGSARCVGKICAHFLFLHIVLVCLFFNFGQGLC